MNYKQIAELIATSKKKTSAKVYIQGDFKEGDFKDKEFQAFGAQSLWILIGDYPLIEIWLEEHRNKIKSVYSEISSRYSALPLLDLSKVEARVEPGAIIRDGAHIGKDCIIMMGAVINIGAEINERTMIDMNAVIGARASIGKDCHIGAGAVIAGVLEPPSKKPVIIEDNVLVGANAVVLEGVKVGRGSVVAASAVVLEDVSSGVVVAGIPAEKIREVKDITEKYKISIVKSLRNRENK
jgi:2,3,4,5-tetrahydropyridine-2,6-dicarboxylate N-acetyltransferase